MNLLTLIIYLPCCLDVTGTINGIHTKDILTKNDIDDLGASHFMTIDGFPSVDISFSRLSFYSPSDVDDNPLTSMTITLEQDIRNKLSSYVNRLDVFKIEVFRDLNLYDSDGYLVKNLIISYENNNWCCPCISLQKVDEGTLGAIHKVTIDYEHIPLTSDPYVKLHKNINDIKVLILNGSLVLSYLLSRDSLQSDTPVVSCDIIEAKNAFTLRETNQLYLYEPTKIDEYVKGNNEYWRQTYSIKEEQELIDGQIFEFIDYFLGFNYALMWSATENKWKGFNCANVVKGNVERMYNEYIDEMYIAVQRNEINLRFLQEYDFDDGNIVTQLIDKGCLTYFLRTEDGVNHAINPYFYPEKDSSFEESGIKYDKSRLIKVRDTEIEDIVPLDDYNQKCQFVFVVTLGTTTTELIWDVVFENSAYYMNVNAIKNLVIKFNFNVMEEIPNTTGNTKDIELFNRKGMESVDPDYPGSGSINPFQLINTKKYYKVKPVPESCSTLYTDYNICSSKVITADNITTMAADLNYVQNFTYDLETEIELVDKKVTTALIEIDKIESQIDSLTFIQIAFGVISLAVNLPGLAGCIGMEVNALTNTATIYFSRTPRIYPADIVDGNIPDTTPLLSNVLPEETTLTGNIYMRFINDCNARLRCLVKDTSSNNYLVDNVSQFFDNTSGLPIYYSGTAENETCFFKQELRLKDDQNFYTNDDNRDLSEATFSAAASLYLLHVLQGEMVDMGNRIMNYAVNKFFYKTDIIQVDEEAKTLVLNKLMIQNLENEQLLIKNEVSNILFSLSKATFENPVAIHDTLTATTIVCDELKNTENQKYITEADIDLNIMKEVIKVLQDDRIQINCTQLHCDLITNTAFEPYALEKNHYTKTEADEKFALKNELSAPDLSEYITKEEVEKTLRRKK